MLLFLADAVEYGEWKLGKRNEAASFAVQPFINQFGGAMSKGVVSFTLIISGLNMIANEIGLYPDREAEIVAGIPDSSVWIMKISMMILPLACILVGFILYQKKFKIDEKLYAQIVADLDKRNAIEEEKDEVHT
jgi:melibiose permease/lactose/raffinose/galactose permease